ncbi:MAG TPA: lysophospholipid acyltransferase family protein [Candidatus Nanoarchaeia archaeon]|nr:lysophospholipid acyltransferase family protein [Candidatus Nanoarchaeia archaeon]
MVYPIWNTLVWSWYQLWVKKIEGIENIPQKGAFIVVLNHSSFYDIALSHGIIAKRLNRKIHPFVNSKFWKNIIAKNILDCGECIPVFVSGDKNSRDKNEKSMKLALKYLKKGDIISIFPEGKRSPDGVLGKAYNGAAKLSIASGAPILPVGIIESYKVLPKGALFPRFLRCRVKIGKPVYPSDFKLKRKKEKLADELTRVFMGEIAKMIGQKYIY